MYPSEFVVIGIFEIVGIILYISCFLVFLKDVFTYFHPEKKRKPKVTKEENEKSTKAAGQNIITDQKSIEMRNNVTRNKGDIRQNIDTFSTLGTKLLEMHH